jgi:hypothetical protein
MLCTYHFMCRWPTAKGPKHTANRYGKFGPPNRPTSLRRIFRLTANTLPSFFQANIKLQRSFSMLFSAYGKSQSFEQKKNAGHR